jgi:hypothetical protein
MKDVERLDDVTLAAPTASIAASRETPGLLSRLFPTVPSGDEVAVRAALATAMGQPTAPEAPEPKGFFAGLFGRDEPDTPEDSGAVVTAEVDTVDPDMAAPALAEAMLPDEKPGFFASLFATKEAEVADASPDILQTEVAQAQDPVPAPTKAGFLVGLTSFFTSDASDAEAAPDDTVPPKAQLDFGELGRTCGLSRGDLGTLITQTSGFEVYDTFPNSTAPRPHYITGFSDGCARQFTAALVLTGDVGTHELVRYARTRVDLPYSETDQAYENIKGQFCGVGEGQPCGTQLERLGANTTFVTAYETFGDSPDWAEFLLHDGAVAAVAIEGL